MTDSRGIWGEGVTLEHLRARTANTLVGHLGIELTEMGTDYLTASMPVDARTCQPSRILHGGASVALAETLGSFAANSVVDTTKFVCVGQEINANHLRPVPEGGQVTGTAKPLHLGARSQVWAIDIFDDRGRRICVSRITMAVINR